MARLAARCAPGALAAALSLLWMTAPGGSGDLAAHLLRAELTSDHGLVLWNGQWFGGHHTIAYSALFPPLAAAIGARLAGALSVVAAAVLFERLMHRRHGGRGTLAALWFAAAAPGMLVMGQLPFALGAALGLGVLLALPGHPRAAAALAAATALASPLAAGFLILCCAAWALAGQPRRAPVVAGAAALATTLVLALVFPEGGTQAFSRREAAWAVAIGAAGLLGAPRDWRAGVVLYLAGIAAAAAVATPVGSNATRLAFWFGGPLLAAALLAETATGRRRRAALAVGVVVAAAWQAQVIPRAARGLDSPSSRSAFYEPLMRFLERERRRDGGRPWRVHVPTTAVKWEAFAVAREFPIARGWYRQLDRRHNPIFYGEELTHARYEAWLHDSAVRFVALPGAPLDRRAVHEARLVEAGPRYLRERWRAPGWRVFETARAPVLARAEAGARIDVVALRAQDVALRVRRPGAATVKVRWSPYWHLEDGCVEPAGGWTRVSSQRPGAARMTIRPSLDRLLARGRRCA